MTKEVRFPEDAIEMAPRKKKDTPSLEDLPKSLRMAIVRLMAKYNLDYPEALEKAALLLDINSRAFDEEVKKEANRMYKSQFMIQLNKARATIERDCKSRIEAALHNGYNQGYNKAKEDYGVWYNCKVCNEPIYIRPNSEPHRRVNEFLRSQGWGHTACHEKRKRGR